MQVNPNTFTVAEYCDQMASGAIVVNKEYQRSSKVWPPAAKSFLIDTILCGFPMPKLSLYQKTDVKSRKTLKEIVDGQQRSQAIQAFYADELRISGHTEFAGKRFTQLKEEDQQRFLSYGLPVDVFVGATDSEIREVFRRINSYNVPLNPPEKRHAVYQGLFKWFVLEQCKKYSQSLKDLGVLAESQISRMADASLITEICVAMHFGHQHASETKNDQFYRDRETEFPEEHAFEGRLRVGFEKILELKPIHDTPLMKPYNFYSLILAVMHTVRELPALKIPSDNDRAWHEPRRPWRPELDVVLANLGLLADALEQEVPPAKLADFVEACSKATNRMNQRKTRFCWFCTALQPKLLG
jgi:Protein of unknown function DUF262